MGMVVFPKKKKTTKADGGQDLVSVPVGCSPLVKRMIESAVINLTLITCISLDLHSYKNIFAHNSKMYFL